MATIEQLPAKVFLEFDDCVEYGVWQWGDVSNKLLPAGRLLYDDFNQPMHGYYRHVVRCRHIENLAPVGEVEYLDCWSGRGQTYSWCWGYPEAEGEWAWNWGTSNCAACYRPSPKPQTLSLQNFLHTSC